MLIINEDKGNEKKRNCQSVFLPLSVFFFDQRFLWRLTGTVFNRKQQNFLVPNQSADHLFLTAE